MRGEEIRKALEVGRLVDITTIGRRTGRAHRIEIPYFNVDGRLFVIGDPRTHDEARELRPRDWYDNLRADPRVTLHLKRAYRIDLGQMVQDVLFYDGAVEADLPARATPVEDAVARRQVLLAILPKMGARGYAYDFEDWVKYAPIVEITVDGEALGAEPPS
jgi:hypothetical protein